MIYHLNYYFSNIGDTHKTTVRFRKNAMLCESLLCETKNAKMGVRFHQLTKVYYICITIRNILLKKLVINLKY